MDARVGGPAPEGRHGCVRPCGERAKDRGGAEMHPSSWWLFGTSTLGDGRGRREELGMPQEEEMVVACPELLLPAPATSPSCCCHPRLGHAAADDLPNLQLPSEAAVGDKKLGRWLRPAGGARHAA
nr:uncharacterized protein LOC127300447 [Lolium perenne]